MSLKDYYKQSLSQTSSYMQRFVSFLLFTQINFFLWYIVFAILVNTVEVISFVPLVIGAIIQLIFLVSFLLKGIKAKSATYVATGSAYLAITVLVYYLLGNLGLWEAMVFILLGLWNAGCGILILLIGLTRVFIFGVKKDYQM